MGTLFTKKLATFLRDLENNNDRDWFHANKARYEADVLEPTQAFIVALRPQLGKISKHLIANEAKSGGSMMRLHRDVRFSKDKTPFNTNVSMIFPVAGGKRGTTPGFYARFTRSEVFLGAGMWHPDSPQTERIRRRIVAESREWKTATRSAAFTDRLALSGESLKRPPRGFDAEHPLVEDLKRKDFCGFRTLKASELVAPDFLETVLTHYKAGNKLVRFLSRALELPY